MLGKAGHSFHLESLWTAILNVFTPKHKHPDARITHPPGQRKSTGGGIRTQSVSSPTHASSHPVESDCGGLFLLSAAAVRLQQGSRVLPAVCSLPGFLQVKTLIPRAAAAFPCFLYPPVERSPASTIRSLSGRKPQQSPMFCPMVPSDISQHTIKPWHVRQGELSPRRQRRIERTQGAAYLIRGLVQPSIASSAPGSWLPQGWEVWVHQQTYVLSLP